MLTNTSKNSPKLLGSKLSTAYWFKTEHVGPCTRTRFLTGRSKPVRLVFHTDGAARSTINDLHPIQHVQHLHLQSLELWRYDPAELRLCHGKVSVVFDITYMTLYILTCIYASYRDVTVMSRLLLPIIEPSHTPNKFLDILEDYTLKFVLYHTSFISK